MYGFEHFLSAQNMSWCLQNDKRETPVKINVIFKILRTIFVLDLSMNCIYRNLVEYRYWRHHVIFWFVSICCMYFLLLWIRCIFSQWGIKSSIRFIVNKVECNIIKTNFEHDNLWNRHLEIILNLKTCLIIYREKNQLLFNLIVNGLIEIWIIAGEFSKSCIASNVSFFQQWLKW